jgi:hypothetical protein
MFQSEHSALCSNRNIVQRPLVITFSYCSGQRLKLLWVAEVPKYRQAEVDSFRLTKRLSIGLVSGCGKYRTSKSWFLNDLAVITVKQRS